MYTLYTHACKCTIIWNGQSRDIYKLRNTDFVQCGLKALLGLANLSPVFSSTRLGIPPLWFDTGELRFKRQSVVSSPVVVLMHNQSSQAMSHMGHG